ncbi:hypothetical protein [Micromonospora sp. NPDC005220]|uniref:hypothetical protein n=1 Tax=Micromonospora sp. NPDC005220 TaxID=3155589 RepID=UPI0033B74A3F
MSITLTPARAHPGPRHTAPRPHHPPQTRVFRRHQHEEWGEQGSWGQAGRPERQSRQGRS